MSVTVYSARARCVSDCSVRGRGVSMTVFSARARCGSDSVQCEGKVCQ